MVRYQLGVILEYIFLSIKFYGALKQALKFVNFFHRLLSINTNFCQIISLVDSSLLFLVDSWNSLWIHGTPCGLEVYYQKLTVQFLFHQDSIVCAFFKFLRHQLVISATSVGIRSLTYPSLIAYRRDYNDHHNNDK